MLFLVFRIGDGRFAFDARRIVEIIPLVTIKPALDMPSGIAGVIAYQGESVPIVDVGQVMAARPAENLLSSRILIVRPLIGNSSRRLLGLIVPGATEMIRSQAQSSDGGAEGNSGRPVLSDGKGTIQCLDESDFLRGTIKEIFLGEAMRPRTLLASNF